MGAHMRMLIVAAIAAVLTWANGRVILVFTKIVIAMFLAALALGNVAKPESGSA